MQNKFFNENEFQYALNYIGKNPFVAKDLFNIQKIIMLKHTI